MSCLNTTCVWKSHFHIQDFCFIFCTFLWYSPWSTGGFNRITKQFPLTGGTIPVNPAYLLATGLAEQLAPVPLPGNADSNSYSISAANRLYSESRWLMNCASAAQIRPDLREENSSFGMSAALRETLHHGKYHHRCVGRALRLSVAFSRVITHVSHAEL